MVAGHAGGLPGGRAHRAQRGDVPRQRRGHRAGPRRDHRRPPVAVPAQPAREHRQRHRHPLPLPQRLDPRRQDLPRHQRRLHRRPRRPHRRAGVGDAAGRLPRAGGADGGADHRQRQAHQRLALQPVEPAPRRLLHHRPRRRQRRGALAHQHRGHPGPVRRRHVGRPAPRRPAARLGVDGRQLRPRPPPRLLGHGAARAPARVATRGRQGGPPLHELDPRPRPRHRRDGVVLPAPAPRQLGPRPRIRADDRRDRGVAEPRVGAVDQPRGDARASGARSSPASPARPASSGPSTPPPASSCGRGRPSTRTS